MSKCCENCKYFHSEEYPDVNYDAHGGLKQVLERRCFCYALPPVLRTGDRDEFGDPLSGRPQVSGGDHACRYFESSEEETTETTTKGESWTKF